MNSQPSAQHLPLASQITCFSVKLPTYSCKARKPPVTSSCPHPCLQSHKSKPLLIPIPLLVKSALLLVLLAIYFPFSSFAHLNSGLHTPQCQDFNKCCITHDVVLQHTSSCDCVDKDLYRHFDGPIMPEVTAALAGRFISCPTPQGKLIPRPALKQSDSSR